MSNPTLPTAAVPKEPCFCQQLHNHCDPTTCSEAPILRLGSIADTGVPKNDRGVFYCSWTELADAAEAGCLTCQTIRMGVDAFEDDTLEDEVDYGCRVLFEQEVMVCIEISEKRFEYSQTSPSGCRAFPSTNFIPRATGTSSAFEQCRKWVKDCSETHTVCQAEITVLPHRVVDIGWNGDGFTPHLHESENEIGEYSALSHCWGSVPTIKTTTRTISDRKSAIPWDMLSKTFQEAIIVTQELGLQYIWVDSLCIIQDDKCDWEQESKKMGAVYGNSKVTIAAVKSKDGDGGCFVENDKVVIFTPPALYGTMAIRKYYPLEGYSYSANQTESEDKPLFHRAWTLQEELLAPRVLYFGPMEIVFQCRTLLDCQYEKKHLKRENTPKRQYEEARLASSDANDVLRSWACIIQQYSTRRLTVETDLFPALSGLTKTFLNRGLGEFVAGVWIKDLPLWLTWESWHPKAPRTKTYVAPYWSWASRGGPIKYSLLTELCYQKIHSHLTILDVACEPTGLDPTGAIRTGILIARGRTISAELLPTPDVDDSQFTIRRGGWETRVRLDSPFPRPGFDKHSAALVVHCLLICSVEHNDSPIPITCFLILIAGDQMDQYGLYRRCGLGQAQLLNRTEDCERSAIRRPVFKNKSPSTREIMEWFKGVEELEITLY